MDKLQLIKKRNNDFKRLIQTDGLGKVFLRDNWEQINIFLGDCHYLIQTVEQQQQEYITLFQSVAEDDAIIGELQEELALLKGEISG